MTVENLSTTSLRPDLAYLATAGACLFLALYVLRRVVAPIGVLVQLVAAVALVFLLVVAALTLVVAAAVH